MVPQPGLSPEAPQEQPRDPSVGSAAQGVDAAFPPPAPLVGYEQASYPPAPDPHRGFEQPPSPWGYEQSYPQQGAPPMLLAKLKPQPLPVELREYHQFYRAPAFRWWKPLVAIVLFVVAEFAIVMVAVIGYVVWLLATGQRVPASESDFDPTLMFSLNNVMVALGLPVALMTSWLVFRQRPKWLSSIAGGFRWRYFWRFLAIAAVGVALSTVAEAMLTGGFGELTWTPASLVLILVIVITTPFQCAAEEYSIRGLLFRGVGSWFANRRVGLVVGIAVSSTVFMLVHGAGDPWLNATYFVIGVLFAVLAWRTGGLEAAVAMHIANNLISEMLLPFQPESLAHIFDRQAGVAGPVVLIQIGVTALVAGLLLWQSSRLGPPRATAPAVAVQ